MIKTSPQHRIRDTGEIDVLPHASDIGGCALLTGAVPRLVSGLAIGDLANVVPFRRPKTTQGDAPACVVDAATRPMPPGHAIRGPRFLLAVTAAVLMHGTAFAAFFLYQPPPHPSIGVEAISIEIEIGDNRPSGNGAMPNPDAFDQEKIDAEVKPNVVDPVEEAKLSDKPAEAAAVLPGNDDTNAAQAKSAEPPAEVVIVPAPEALNGQEAKVDTRPEPTPEPKPEPKLEKPIQKPAEKPAPKAAEKPEPKHARKKADHDTDRTRDRIGETAYREQRYAGNGAGPGRSVNDDDYRSRVMGHLLRYKPRIGNASPGASAVTFMLNGSGSVTSARLTSASGNSALDEMALAMVRQASPFPAPPDGRSRQFTAPIKFNR